MFKKKINYKKSLQYPKLIVFVMGFAAGYGYIEFDKREWLSAERPTKEFNVCFTPPAGCVSLIVSEIHRAKHSIHMQVYSFTSSAIAQEIVDAKDRGINVKIIFDKSQLDEKNSKFEFLKKAGVEVKLDHLSGIAHNKVIIIDKRKVITGSYNFTQAAEKRNAENVMLIDNPEIAYNYLKNWHSRYQHSQ